MANIDRILRVQQSYELAKISALNKQMLIAQYAQCEQISALQKQVQQSNSISRQILQNQIEEIKRREKIKYYKSLAYNMNEAALLISNETNPALQVFLGNLFLEAVIINTKESKDNLEDIEDKSFCKEIENKISNIREHINHNRIIYQESEFSNLINWESSYIEKKTKLENRNIETTVHLTKIRDKQYAELTGKYKFRGCLIPISIFLSILLLGSIGVMLEETLSLPNIIHAIVISIFLFFSIYIFIKWKKNHQTHIESLKKNNEKEDEAVENEIVQDNKELESHPYIKTKEIISLQYPNWEEKVELIFSFLPKEEKEQKQWNPPQRMARESNEASQTAYYAEIQRLDNKIAKIQNKYRGTKHEKWFR